MTNKNTKIIIQDARDIQDYFNKEYISSNLKKNLQSADIVILPIEGFRDYKDPIFPHGTEKIYLYLKKNLPKKYNFNISIEDKDYRELALHHDLIYLGIFMIKDIVLPLLLNLLANFAFYKLPLKNDNEKVKLEIVVKGNLKRIIYEGPVKEFGAIIKEIKKVSKK